MKTLIANFQADLFFDYEIPNPYNPAAWRTEYNRYLRTNVWIAKREITKELAGYHCTACLPGCKGDMDLQVHHLHYRRPFGQERCGIDIVCICANCHRNIHAKPIIRHDNDNRPIPAADNENPLSLRRESG